MTNTFQPINIISTLAHQLIAEQFPEYAHFPITAVTKQGHDNRTYRLGNNLLIRMPTAESYALKVHKEQTLLPQLSPHLSIKIPVPVHIGQPSKNYPYPFSIYQWLEGTSINLTTIDHQALEQLAIDLATFLKELQSIKNVQGLAPGQHNWWRGDHVSVYDKQARQQLALLANIMDNAKALDVWERACHTQWNNPPVWIHGDFAIGNMLVQQGKLTAIIDFGGMAMGDPACDLVIAWTYLSGKAREVFIKAIDVDKNTWLRARAWALWKATYELCQLKDKNSSQGIVHKKIIEDLLSE